MMIDYMDSASVERADSTSATVDRVGEDTSAASSLKKPRLLGQYDAPVTAGDSGNDTSATEFNSYLSMCAKGISMLCLNFWAQDSSLHKLKAIVVRVLGVPATRAPATVADR